MQLDLIFASLAHPIRRDILRRGEHEEMSVSELAVPYGVSIAAISKHIQFLRKQDSSVNGEGESSSLYVYPERHSVRHRRI